MNSNDALETLSTQITSTLWNKIKHLSFEQFSDKDQLFTVINIMKSINGIDIDAINLEIKYNYYDDDCEDYIFKQLVDAYGYLSIPIEKCNDVFNEHRFKPIEVKLNIRIKKVNIIQNYKLACKCSVQDIKDQVILLITKIKELRFNNYIGRFYDCKENEFDNYSNDQVIATSFYELFKDNENITLNDLNCSVCIEPTIIHLIKCFHKICVKCIQQLKEPICPLCRVNILEEGKVMVLGRRDIV